jgi:hypothetical protein
MNDAAKAQLEATVLSLVAETKALRFVTGFLLAENPLALARMQRALPRVDDLTLLMALTDGQREQLRASISQILETVQSTIDREAELDKV